MDAPFDILSSSKNESSKKAKSGNLLDRPGQHPRELNPFWKQGGSGLPPTKEEAARKSAKKAMLQRALDRAAEQAKTENRTLEEVAAERWGVSQNINFTKLEYFQFSFFIILITIFVKFVLNYVLVVGKAEKSSGKR